MKTLRLIHAMPRCGSTLLSAHLASMPGIALLSEIHPLLPLVGHPCDQARDWHKLLTSDEAVDWKHRYSCAEILAKLHDRALSSQKTLVVREWSYPDFRYPDPTLESLLPDWTSSLARHCRPHFDEMLRIMLVREPVDQWLSFQAFDARCCPGKKNPIALETVMRSYRAFAEMTGAEIVRFEDLTADPRATLRRVCTLLQLPYTDVGDAWRTCTHVTGDPDLMRSHPSVEVIPRRATDPETLSRLRSCEDYLATCRLLGYPPR